MTKLVNFIKKEPLIHFLFFGALLYIYYNIGQTTTSKKSEVVVIEDSLESQKEAFDLKLLDSAYSLELDKQDVKIKNILINKMLFILSSSNKKEPTQDELLAFYKKNMDDYSKLKKIDFFYIDNISSDRLDEYKNMLNIISFKKDKLKHLSLTIDELSKRFGNYFTFKIKNLSSGVWHILKYPDKNYLIFIDKKQPIKALDFDEVQDRVYKDFKNNQLIKTMQQNYKKL